MVASIWGAIARTLVVAIAATLWPIASAGASPTEPREIDTSGWPVEGNFAVMGLPPFSFDVGGSGASSSRFQLAYGGEIGLRNGFLSIGGHRWADGGGDASITTLYGRAKWRVAAEHTLSLVAGWNHAPAVKACADTCLDYTPYGALIAASWEYRAEHFWVNLTAQYVIPLYGTYYTIDNGVASMVPWVEFGWRITPNVGLGFRLGPAPIKLTFDF